MIKSDELSLEELDYYLEHGTLVDVMESGSDNYFSAVIREFAETDVAEGRHAKVYKCEVTDVMDCPYEIGDVVRVDNRDVVRVHRD